MRFLIHNHIHNARQSLKKSRVRSALTMLGTAIGVASVTAILALGGGASKIVGDQVDSLGGNIAIIRPGIVSKSLTDISYQAQNNTNYATSTLTEKDVESIRGVKHITSVAPLMILSGAIKAASTAPAGSSIVATTPDLAEISGLKVKLGQFIDSTVDKDTVVIGPQLSIDIFGTEASLGQTVNIRGKAFVVIGVLNNTDDPINYNSVNFDNSVIINFESGKEINQDIIQIQQINIKADSTANLEKAVTSIRELVVANHDDQEDFTILTGDQISQSSSQLFSVIAGVTTAIAAISLIVGGIGTMNIMLVTVAERAREIGIRKSLGATNGDIVWQFLIESLLLSIGGGIAGYLGGYALAFSVGSFLTVTPIINLQITGIAIVISIVIGTLFGLYPAIRAARKDPIESLKQYN